MARIKLSFPEKTLFKTELAVRITDINYGGHLGNDAVLGLMHESRLRFLHSLGFSEKDMDGTGLIMGDCAIQYKNEAFYGDKLQAEIGVDDLGLIGFDIYYRFLRLKDLKEIAVAKTGMVCFDYERRRPVPTPESVKAALK